MSEPISIVIADDHPLLRKGLRVVIADDPGLQVVAEAADGEAALAHIAALRPDVVVLDLDMPKRGGFGVVREMRARQVPGRGSVVTMHGEPDQLDEARARGLGGDV
jgi:DNA-binding NarL/FixJ family response regulator